MKQYTDLLKQIIDNGVEKESGRTNMPNTKGISHAVIKMDLEKGFPLLTTKKMFIRGIIHELLWFLRGETNIKYLIDNGVNIWNGDAYRWYQKHYIRCNGTDNGMLSIDDFISTIKDNHYDVFKSWFGSNDPDNYNLGDLGKVYGYQWRNQNGVDQIAEVINGLKENPYSRYHIIDGWNRADFRDMALPPCHLLYQFIVRPLSVSERYRIAVMEKGHRSFRNGEITDERLEELKVPKFYLDLNMYQRSCDTFLGVPFNLASMALLLKIVSKCSNMKPGVATWIGGDTHLYVNHIPMALDQISRTPYDLPKMEITKDINSLEDIEKLTIDDFVLSGYQSHPAIKAELFTGFKK